MQISKIPLVTFVLPKKRILDHCLQIWTLAVSPQVGLIFTFICVCVWGGCYILINIHGHDVYI